jgi:glycosyltransferase involved in cell wall biosynthesis
VSGDVRTIVFVTQPWDMIELPFQSGSSTSIVVYNLARQLADRHQIVICCRRGPGQSAVEQSDEGITVHRFPVHTKPLYQILDRVTSFWNHRPPLFCSRWYYPRFYERTAALASRLGADVVHLMTFFQHLSRFRKKVPDARLVLHMEGETLSLLDNRTAASAADADLVLGCSGFLSDSIATRHPVLADRCRPLLNGVDTTQFAPATATTTSQRLLYVGRLSPEKGIHVLLDAFRIVHREIPEAQLDLVGAPGLLPHAYLVGLSDDPLVRGLEQYYGRGPIDKLMRQVIRKDTSYLNDLQQSIDPATQPAVHFHGTLNHDQLPDVYRKAAACLVPSVCPEPFGLPVAEAMAAGVPVVATSGGGIIELIRDGETGVLVDRGDVDGLASAIIGLLRNPARRSAIGTAGQKWAAENLCWSQLGTRLQTLYDQSIASPGASTA